MIFWFIEFVMDIVRGNECLGFNEGFSLIHFILLYMMSRVTSLYKTEILTIKPIIWILIYLFCIVLICICHIFDFQHTWSYSNPIIIVESFCLFFIFLYKPFYSNKINYIASSSFAVYIIHTTNPILGFLENLNMYILNNYDYFSYLFLYILLSICIFILGVLYDKIREIMTLSYTDKIYNIIVAKLNPFFEKYM